MFDDGGHDGAAPTLAMLQTRLGESALQRVRRELTGTTGGSPHHYCRQPTPLLQVRRELTGTTGGALWLRFGTCARGTWRVAACL